MVKKYHFCIKNALLATLAATAAGTRGAERILIDFRGGIAARAKFGKGTIYKYSEKVAYVFKTPRFASSSGFSNLGNGMRRGDTGD